MSVSRRAWLRVTLGTLVAGLVSACQSSTSQAPTPVPQPTASTAKSEARPALTLTLANSELAVGQNRFAMAVIEGGRPVVNAAVKFEFFELEGQSATKRSEANANFRSVEQGAKGLYVARVAFDQSGPWGVQVNVARDAQQPLTGRRNFEVVARASSPMPGDRAIPSRSPTARDVNNLEAICSGLPPCDMHDLSIADALSQARPSMLLFATPGYCTSQTCAPVLGEVQKVRAPYSGRVSFVHVEIYKDPRNLVVADAVTEWNLQSEPWVFVVDRGGVIAERIESITSAEELEASLAPVL